MPKPDDTQQAAELRLAFVRHLPKRLATLRKRGLRLCRQGWDINALALLFAELQTLAGACGRYGLLDMSERLFALESFVAPFVENVAIPNASESESFARHLNDLVALIERHEAEHGEPAMQAAEALTVAPIQAGSYPLQVTPPPEYWKRLGAPTLAQPQRAHASASSAQSAQAPQRVQAPPAAAAADALPAPDAPRSALAAPQLAAAIPEQFKVFHLSDGNALACEVDQKLEAAGYELTLLDSLDELKEVLAVFAPHLVIIDAPFEEALDEIGELIKAVRGHLGRRLALLAFSESALLPMRLRAMRAGADGFIVLPAQSGEVMARIGELLQANSGEPFRVLIVEDDRSQALFAESILRKAGMTTAAVTDPLAALDQLDSFKPELILMDLYMPSCSGMELTAIIREREAFINTPIVFLSGEHDEDKHFEALSAGGDDFLSKPIRPRHLISAVTNRVRRARSLSQRVQTRNPRDPVTGLYQRAHVLDRLNASLSDDERDHNDGGLLFVELEGAGQIRERVGLTVFEALLNQIGAFIASHIDNGTIAARYGDTSFVLLCERGDEAELVQLAERLRKRTMEEVFEEEGKTLSVSLAFGICAFTAGLGDALAMLNAAERALRDARGADGDRVGVFKPAAEAGVGGSEPGLSRLLHEALEAENFQLLFQPIVALQDTEEEQFQALLRLRGDDGRLYTAAEILPLAEREGLAADIDRWVVSRCLLVVAERMRQRRPVRLFVSQCIEAAGDPQRAAWLAQMLDARRLPGAQLVLEFRTTDAIAHVREVSEFGAALSTLEVKVCLSAFDASPNAVQLLRHLPAAFLKLSARFSGNMLRDARVREELQQIVRLAHDHNSKVIAPRIEDAQTASLLWSAEVDYLQGDFVQQAGQDLSFDFHAATA